MSEDARESERELTQRIQSQLKSVQWTPQPQGKAKERQAVFLSAVRKGERDNVAAAHAGVSKDAVRKWRQKDPVFRAEHDKAKQFRFNGLRPNRTTRRRFNDQKVKADSAILMRAVVAEDSETYGTKITEYLDSPDDIYALMVDTSIRARFALDFCSDLLDWPAGLVHDAFFDEEPVLSLAEFREAADEALQGEVLDGSQGLTP